MYSPPFTIPRDLSYMPPGIMASRALNMAVVMKRPPCVPEEETQDNDMVSPTSA